MSDLEKKLSELEKRIEELERRPVYYPQPVWVWPPNYPAPAPAWHPWWTSATSSVSYSLDPETGIIRS